MLLLLSAEQMMVISRGLEGTVREDARTPVLGSIQSMTADVRPTCPRGTTRHDTTPHGADKPGTFSLDTPLKVREQHVDLNGDLLLLLLVSR